MLFETSLLIESFNLLLHIRFINYRAIGFFFVCVGKQAPLLSSWPFPYIWNSCFSTLFVEKIIFMVENRSFLFNKPNPNEFQHATYIRHTFPLNLNLNELSITWKSRYIVNKNKVDCLLLSKQLRYYLFFIMFTCITAARVSFMSSLTSNHMRQNCGRKWAASNATHCFFFLKDVTE